MQHRDVPVALVAAILAAGELAIVLLEVPTGWLADRFGHRRSLILGSVIQTMAMLLCWRAEGVSGLVAASVCVALGDTFRSGADQALLYRSCAAAGQVERFQRIESQTSSLELIGLIAMMVAGGVLVETVGFAAAWIAETVLASSGVVIALLMAEPPDDAPRDSNHSGTARRWDGATLVSMLLPVIVPAALIGAAANAAAFLAQTGPLTSPAQVTALVCVITLFEAAGAAVSGYLPPHRRTHVLLLAAGVGCTVAIFVHPVLLLPGTVAIAFVAGAAEPVRAAAIQTLVESHRAQAASWASAIDGGVRLVALSLAGLASPHRSRRPATKITTIRVI